MKKFDKYRWIWFRTLIGFFMAGLVGSLVLAAEKPQFQIIQQNGTLFQQKGEKFIALEKDQKPDGTNALRIGEQTDPSTLTAEPVKLLQSSLVISYSKTDLLTLTSGSTVSYKLSKKNIPEFNLTGAIHLFILKQEEAAPMQVSINGTQYKSPSAHLFFNGLGAAPEITVVEGEVSAMLPVSVKPLPADASVDTKKPAAKAELKETPLKPLTRLTLKKDEVSITEGIKLEEDPVYLAATLPGFEVSGAYKKAGYTVFLPEPLLITRYGKAVTIKNSPTALLEGDEIKTGKGQTATLYLDSKDDLRLSPESVFTIEQFVQTDKESALLTNFSGTVRARIAKRSGTPNIHFKTATASIGVKGTDFEATASAQSSEVATVEGEVGVADPAGNGEVSVKAGMMTSVAAGALPEAPKPIPPDRFQKLNEEAIPLNEANLIELKKIKIISPLSEKTYSKPILALAVEPENATWQALLDEKNLIIRNGDSFLNIAEGTHQLTIKGIGKDPVNETVRFTVDQTAPAPTNLEPGFILRQGTPLVINWSEPVEKLTILFEGKPLNLKQSNDRKSSEVNSDTLFQKPEVKTVILSLKAADLVGNESSFERTITLKFKPDKPPVVVIGEGKPLFITRQLDKMKITADRPIEKWEAILDGQPITPPKPTEDVKSDDLKKELLLQLSDVKVPEKETHLLTVQATDDFNLTGSQNLEIRIDQIPPVLAEQVTLLNSITAEGEARQLSFKQLFVKEGETVQFKWNEPLSSATYKFENQTPVSLTITADQTGAELRGEEIKKIFGSPGFKKLSISAKDLAGNLTESQGTMFYKPRPAQLPTILIGNGDASLLLNQAPTLTLKANRELFQWKVILNGKELEFLTAEEKKNASAKQQIVLKPELFSGIDDGIYKLMIFATDDFLLPASQEVSFVLDRNKPVITNLPEGVHFNKLKLEKGASVHLEFNEKVYRLEATLDKKNWPLSLEADGTRLILNGNPERLDYTPKSYRIALFDRVNNVLELQGTVALRLPRWQALKDNFDNSILLATGDPADQLMLADRPNFSLDNALTDPSLNDLSAKESGVFKERYERDPDDLKEVKPSFTDGLDDPLANDFRLETP